MRSSILETKFSDFSLTFKPHPFTGDITCLKNEDAVKNSVKNLILTGFYERPFYPSKGCGIYHMLFEPISPATSIAIQEQISSTIDNWEPRANLVDVITEPDYDNNGYNVTIVYEIINDVEIKEINFFLERVR